MKNNNRILKKPCQHLDLPEKALSKKAKYIYIYIYKGFYA